MIKRKKILVLGGSSYIGRNLFSRLGPRRSVATYYRHLIKDGVYFDALKMDIPDVAEKPEIFSHAVILLGNTNPDSCARNIEQSERLNVVRICALIDQLKRSAVTPVFMSTEAVFDGRKGGYSETDRVNPVLTYGSQKARVEKYLQQNCAKFLIVRLGRVFGSCRGDGTLFTSWLDQLERGMEIKCARDHLFSPIHVNEVVEGLARLMRGNNSGIFHLSGKNAYARSDMLKTLLKHYKNYRRKDIRITECSINNFPVAEKRPLDVSMKPDKILKSTGLEIK
ncbi:MAG: sugar nucleotide-binding protein, partial [Candidatus Omnitrophica bacterium]|nr:sugar nucleotide-binding protein [Candidatus Omnitrophota bacterium]